jgi:hypothetical protein
MQLNIKQVFISVDFAGGLAPVCLNPLRLYVVMIDHDPILSDVIASFYVLDGLFPWNSPPDTSVCVIEKSIQVFLRLFFIKCTYTGEHRRCRGGGDFILRYCLVWMDYRDIFYG